jgi:hypothetical protein
MDGFLTGSGSGAFFGAGSGALYASGSACCDLKNASSSFTDSLGGAALEIGGSGSAA